MDIDETIRRNEILNNAIGILKSEYFGIDSIIEGIMRNMKTWYLFGDLMDRPLVISLWGMTGCGKTSLVNRICELLELSDSMLYYNTASYSGQDNYCFMKDLSDMASIENSKKVIVFDEFQMAATIDGDGMESDHGSYVSGIWELIDTGRPHMEYKSSIIVRMRYLIDSLNELESISHIELVNGVWVNQKEISPEDFDLVAAYTYYITYHIKRSDDSKNGTNRFERICTDGYYTKGYFLSDEFTRDTSNVLGIPCEDVRKDICAITDVNGLISYVKNVLRVAKSGIAFDFSKSLIFVIGNLDEAYTISHNMDPDMDADQFRKITEKLTIIDAKNALLCRFRSEQIARLGNIMYMYPSLGSDDFRKIIDGRMKSYAKSLYDKTGITLEWDESVSDMVYKDSVLPTHGTRSVYSCISEMIAGSVAGTLSESPEFICSIKTIKMSFFDNAIICRKIIDNGIYLDETKHPYVSRIESKRKVEDTEMHAISAVHESGHFVVYCALYGKIPEKVMSSTVSSDTGGFVLMDPEEYSDYSMLKRSVSVSLAGYAAEKIVFGRTSSGVSSDMENATSMVSSMIRKYGMGKDSCGYSGPVGVSTYSENPSISGEGMFLKDSNDDTIKVNESAGRCLSECIDMANKILSGKLSEMFKESVSYLMDHESIPKNVMNDIYRKYSDIIMDGNVLDDNFFRDSVKKFLK